MLGERAELHRTYISDVERGARNLSLEAISRIAHALGIPMQVLFKTVESISEAKTAHPSKQFTISPEHS